jgi:hypothetical protein
MPEWRNGRRKRLKISRWKHLAGSSPASGTTLFYLPKDAGRTYSLRDDDTHTISQDILDATSSPTTAGTPTTPYPRRTTPWRKSFASSADNPPPASLASPQTNAQTIPTDTTPEDTHPLKAPERPSAKNFSQPHLGHYPKIGQNQTFKISDF